jgi:hypothetical protein
MMRRKFYNAVYALAATMERALSAQGRRLRGDRRAGMSLN